jgi:hypothetical protein
MTSLRLPFVLLGFALSAGYVGAQVIQPANDTMSGNVQEIQLVNDTMPSIHAFQIGTAKGPPTYVGPAAYSPPQYPIVEEARPGGFVRRCLNKCGLGCWSHHNRPTCSSCRSELTFIFGSCRAFFGEPCMQGPPAIPLPPGYTWPTGGYGGGYHGGGYLGGGWCAGCSR